MALLKSLIIFIELTYKMFVICCGIYEAYDEINYMKFHETLNFTSVFSNKNDQVSIKYLLNVSNCEYFFDKLIDLKFNTTIEAINPNISIFFKPKTKIYTENPFIKMEIKHLTLFFGNSFLNDNEKDSENAIFEFLNQSFLVIYVF